MTTSEQKSMIAGIGALLFVLLSLPFMYGLTNKIAPASYPYANASGPTVTGILVHGIVFFALAFMILNLTEDKEKSM